MSSTRVLTTVVTAVFVAACVGLGIWQLGRLDEVRERNARLLERGSLPVADVREVLAAGPEAAYRRVRVTGSYDAARELILEGRAFRGLSGYHVVTPLRLEDGSAILVNRGWVEIQDGDPPFPGAEPPSGRVSVTGILAPSQTRGRFGPQELGELERVFRLDTTLLRPRFPYPVAALYLQLEAPEPPRGEAPEPVPLEALPEGPHLSYAIQWFLFATGGIVGSAALTREARRRRGLRENAEIEGQPVGDRREETGDPAKNI